MAQTEIIGLQSTLGVFQGTFTSGDTILNSSKGILTLCIGTVETTAGSGAKTAVEVDGSEINLKTGEVSSAITLNVGEGLFIKNTRQAMSGTADATMSYSDLAVAARSKK